MLPLVRSVICGKANQKLNSRQIESDSDKIVKIIAQHGTAATDVFTKVAKICSDLGTVTSDQLKRQTILTEMLAKVSEANPKGR